MHLYLLWRAFYVSASPMLSNQCWNIFEFLKWREIELNKVLNLFHQCFSHENIVFKNPNIHFQWFSTFSKSNRQTVMKKFVRLKFKNSKELHLKKKMALKAIQNVILSLCEFEKPLGEKCLLSYYHQHAIWSWLVCYVRIFSALKHQHTSAMNSGKCTWSKMCQFRSF